MSLNARKLALKFVCIAGAQMGDGLGPEHYVYDPARCIAKRLKDMWISEPDELGPMIRIRNAFGSKIGLILTRLQT